MYPEIVLALFFITGLVSGLLGGLLGIGGGVVTVPFLYYYFLYSGYYPNKIMQVAVCTSLAAAFVTSSIATYFQWKKKAIQFFVIQWMAPTLLIGCLVGALASHLMESRLLSLIFASIAILMGIYFLFPKLPFRIASEPNPTLSLFALIIGILSSMLGIGGGSIAFPVLLGYQIPAKNASATSSAITWITTGLGTLAYLIVIEEFPGYIDLTAWAAISLGSLITSGLGVHLSRKLKVPFIKRVFGICLFAIALSMFFD